MNIEPKKCNNNFWDLLVNNGFSWKNLWDSDKNYHIGDIVSYDGKLYICVINNNNIKPLDNNIINDEWNLFIDINNKIFLQCINYNNQTINPDQNLIFENNIVTNTSDIIYDNNINAFIIKKSSFYNIVFNVITNTINDLKLYLNNNQLDFNLTIKSDDNFYYNLFNYNSYINSDSLLYVKNTNLNNSIDVLNNNNNNIYLYINEN